MTIRDRVLAVVTREVGSIITEADDPIDAVLASDFRCDSLHRISIMVSIEEEFGIDIHDREDALMGEAATIRDLVRLVEGKLQGSLAA